MLDNDVICVDRIEYERLQERDKFLSCLEATGVDNWIGYDEACAMFHEGEQL